MCEFHDSKGTGFGDIWLTDKLIYFSSIYSYPRIVRHVKEIEETTSYV